MFFSWCIARPDIRCCADYAGIVSFSGRNRFDLLLPFYEPHREGHANKYSPRVCRQSGHAKRWRYGEDGVIIIDLDFWKEKRK